MVTADRSSPQTATQLTGFQRDVLFVVAAIGPANGQDLKAELNQEYSDQVLHGRLYTNLDKLIDRGFVNRGAIDGRTNRYSLTDRARQTLESRNRWEQDCLEGVDA